MTTDDKIRDKKLQYDINREAKKNYNQANNGREIIEQASIFSFQKSVVKTEKQVDDKDANFTKFYELDYESKH